MDTPITQPSKSPARRRKLLVGAAAALGALALTAAVVRRDLETDPIVSIPASAPPSPNAFDGYARATALMKDGDEIDASSAPGLQPEKTPSRETQKRILRDNAPALAAFHQSLASAYLNPPLRSFNAEYPNLAPDRRFARLLALKANVEAAQGDWGTSAQTSLDGLTLGSNIPRGAPLIHLLVGIAVNAISRKPIRRAIPHLTLPETQAALARLQTIDSGAQPLAQTFREEKWLGQGGLMEIYRQKNWRNQFFTASGMNDEEKQPFTVRLSAALTSKRRVMYNYTFYMDTVISDAEARRPISLPSPDHSDPFTEVLTPVFSKIDEKYSEDRTQNALLEVELALRAYQLQHHAYPAKLADLSPSLLTAPPPDPFAPAHPLAYQNKGVSYLLYSVGPDGVDDGGKAIYDPKHRDERSRRFVQIDSKGDVVSGVNF